MRLTPLDIKKQEFTRALRGFDAEEVQAFLKTMANQWGDMQDEHRRMEDKVREAELKLEHYQRIEEALQEALHTARQSSRQALDHAERQARLIIKEAEGEADEIKRQALRDRDTLEREAGTLHERRDEIVARLRAFLASEVELLSRFDGGDFLGARLLQPASRQSEPRIAPPQFETAEFELEAEEVAFVPPVPDLSMELSEEEEANLFPPEETPAPVTAAPQPVAEAVEPAMPEPLEEMPEPVAATPQPIEQTQKPVEQAPEPVAQTAQDFDDDEDWSFEEFNEVITQAANTAEPEPEPMAVTEAPAPAEATAPPAEAEPDLTEETTFAALGDRRDVEDLSDAYLQPEEDETSIDLDETIYLERPASLEEVTDLDETIYLETPDSTEEPAVAEEEPSEMVEEAALQAAYEAPVEADQETAEEEKAVFAEADEVPLSFKFFEPTDDGESFFHGDERDPKFSTEGDGMPDEPLSPEEEEEGDESLGAGWLVQSMLSAANAVNTDGTDEKEKIKASATNDEIEKIRRILNDLE